MMHRCFTEQKTRRNHWKAMLKCHVKPSSHNQMAEAEGDSFLV
jgi:hypothetical protein